MSYEQTSITDFSVSLICLGEDGSEWTIHELMRGRSATDPEVLSLAALRRRTRPALSHRRSSKHPQAGTPEDGAKYA